MNDKLQEALTQHGLILKGRRIEADPTNTAAARVFVADLRNVADEADAKADAGMHSKANRLRQNARAARRDADRIELSMK